VVPVPAPDLELYLTAYKMITKTTSFAPFVGDVFVALALSPLMDGQNQRFSMLHEEKRTNAK
jgi:hypothetical protein